jgi:predicted phage-related endonuclease
MGISPYKTADELLQDKVYGAVKDSSKSFLFAKGHKIERQHRDMLNDGENRKFKPQVVISKKVKDLMASLDGLEILENEDIALEVKYVSAERLNSLHAGDLSPDHYYQVQSQLLATGARHCFYIASNGQRHISKKIYPDPQAFQKIIEAVESFKKRLENANVITLPRSQAVPKEEVAFVNIEDERLAEMCHLKERIDQATTRFNKLKADLSKIYAQHNRIKGFGIKMMRSTRKGSIRYSEIPEIKAMDLEKYRSPESEVITITFDDDYQSHDIEVEEF